MKTTWTIQQLFSLLRKNPAQLTAYLLLAPACALLSVLFALSLEPILSAGIALDAARLGRAAPLALLLAALDTGGALWLYRSRTALTRNSVAALRQELMNGVLAQEPAAFSRRDGAWYTAHFSNSAERVKALGLDSLCRIYESGWSFLLSMAALLLHSPALSLFLLLTGLLAVRIPAIFAPGLQRRQAGQLRRTEEHLGLLQDILRGYGTIHSHGVERQFMEKYAQASHSLAQAEARADFAPRRAAAVSSAVTTAVFIGTISLSAYLVIRGRLAVGFVLSLSQLMGGVLLPMEDLPQALSDLRGGGQVLAELHPLRRTGAFRAVPTPPPSAWQILRAEGITVRYGDGQAPILEDAALTLERGKKYALIGPSGCGKSTLAKVLAGICPGSFRLTVDGQPAPASALTQRVSYLEQGTFLFHDTIYENISLYRNRDRDQVRQLLAEMALGGRLAGEDLLDLPVGDAGGQLSGGERQRVALARELLDRREILLLDEADAALDPATAAALAEKLLSLADTTCLVITHRQDPALLARYDGVLTLAEGKLRQIR